MKRKLNNSGYRRCLKCKEEKPLTSEFFYADKNRLAGLMYRCKACEKCRKDKRILRWRNMTDDQKKRAKATNRKYMKSISGRSIAVWFAYKKFDKKKRFKNDLKKSDIVNALNSLCHYCGSPATGFDRINNKEGHTKSNVVPCCKECNVARMDNFTHQEMMMIGDSIRIIKCERELRDFGNCVF